MGKLILNELNSGHIDPIQQRLLSLSMVLKNWPIAQIFFVVLSGKVDRISMKPILNQKDDLAAVLVYKPDVLKKAI